MDAKTLWNIVLGELEVIASPMIYNGSLAPSKAKNLTEDSMELYCKTQYNILSIKKIQTFIDQSIEKVLGHSIKIEYKIQKENGTKPENLGPLFQPQTKTPQTDEFIFKDRSIKAGLSPYMLFENYIVGQNNQLAYAVAQAIAENPGQRYNPFFLYSGVGLGKTHLIQAIGNEIIKKKPDLKVIYTTGETFTNELIAAIRGGKGKTYNPAGFRKKYRDVDVFLIDDIQFIAGKDSTQQEFFHTFNTLHMAQKQVVITSDRHPRNFNNLEDRITSRFSMGMLSDISKPDVDMRIALLQEKRSKLNEEEKMPDEVINFIAEKIDSNIRELEGAYNQVVTAAMSEGSNITLELAAQTLGQVIQDKQNRAVNLNDILKTVANYYSVTVKDIKGKRRTKQIVIPRQVAMSLIYEITSTPYQTIGQLIGGRDHTTVMHGIRKVESGMGDPQKLKQDLVNIKNELYH